MSGVGMGLSLIMSNAKLRVTVHQLTTSMSAMSVNGSVAGAEMLPVMAVMMKVVISVWLIVGFAVLMSVSLERQGV